MKRRAGVYVPRVGPEALADHPAEGDARETVGGAVLDGAATDVYGMQRVRVGARGRGRGPRGERTAVTAGEPDLEDVGVVSGVVAIGHLLHGADDVVVVMVMVKEQF
jgi:hypothetical protein